MNDNNVAVWGVVLGIIAVLGAAYAIIQLEDVRNVEPYDDAPVTNFMTVFRSDLNTVRNDIQSLKADSLDWASVQLEVRNKVRSEFAEQRIEIFEEVNDQLEDLDLGDDVKNLEDDIEDCAKDAEDIIDDDNDHEEALEDLIDCLRSL